MQHLKLAPVFLAAFVSMFLVSCATPYSLVATGSRSVAKGSISISTQQSWNKISASAGRIPQEEVWTKNGPLLDELRFIGALKSGGAITRQKPKDDQKVPQFRADMSPQDLVAMLESFYRVARDVKVFSISKVAPRTFLGKNSVDVEYSFVTGDDVKRRGRAAIAVVDDKLYMISVHAASMHYYDVLLPEFEAITNSAAL